MDILFGLGSQIIWPILLILGGLLAAFGWGAKKKREGRLEERDRAREARDAAAREAVKTREKTASKPITKQREDLKRWER